MLARPTWAGLAMCGALSLALPAQEKADKQDEMKANFAELKAEEWFIDGGWSVDWEGAKAEAAKTGKPIFAYFTRSYAY